MEECAINITKDYADTYATFNDYSDNINNENILKGFDKNKNKRKKKFQLNIVHLTIKIV